MSDDVVAPLRELLRKATPGPWEFSDSSDARGHTGEFRARSPYNGFMLVGPWTNQADHKLMIAAANALPALLDVVEAVCRAKVKRVPRHRVSMLVNDWQAVVDAINAIEASS